MYKITDKLAARGVESLTDGELLTLLFDETQSAQELSERLLDSYSGVLTNIVNENLSRLRMVDGVGIKRAQRIVVAAEIGRRCAIANSTLVRIVTTSADVVAMFRPILEGLKHEECWILYLNASNRVVEQTKVSQGGVTATVVDHRLIVKRALELLATQIVVVHNHPSGSFEPSDEDGELTQKIKSAAALFDIRLLDHIIISSTGEFSFLSGGLL